MYRIVCALIAMIGYGAAGQCQAPQAGTTAVTFQSSTYSDFRQLLAREAATATVTIRGKLDFPQQAMDRYPAVIVVHTLGGYRDANEGYVAAELRKAGFATLTYDGFAARGTTGEALSASPGYLPAGVADAYAALRQLASEPRIDANLSAGETYTDTGGNRVQLLIVWVPGMDNADVACTDDWMVQAPPQYSPFSIGIPVRDEAAMNPAPRAAICLVNSSATTAPLP